MATIFGASSDSSNLDIPTSLLFNRGHDNKLTFTPGSAGATAERQKFTVSCWIKRCNLGSTATQYIWEMGGNDNANERIFARFQADDSLRVGDSGTVFRETGRKFRDVSAWYHIVVAFDTTDGTAGNRVKVYVNGVQETVFATSNNPSQNDQKGFSHNSVHTIGRSGVDDTLSFDGYMANFDAVGGAQITPSNFGKTDTNGQWIPIKYTGSFGTNGFKLEFKGTGTSADSSGMGADTSGNDNHFAIGGDPNFTAVKIMPDTPTNNWANLNGQGATDSQGATGTLSSGNLVMGTNQKAQGLTIDNIMLDGGKWYFEVYLVTSSSLNTTIGFRNSDNGDDTPSIEIENDGQIKKDSSNVGSTDTAFSNGMVVGVILDWSNPASRKITFETNNSAHSEGQQTFSVGSQGYHFHGRETGSGSTHIYNFGQNGAFFGNLSAGNNADGNGLGNFKYAVPSNHFAICSKNLATEV